MKVYNLGSLNIDYVYKVPHFVAAKETLSSSSLQTFPGGKGLNQSVSLAKAGIPVIHGAVLGDNGQFLHAHILGFVHPRSNEYMEFKSELPDYYQEYIKELENEMK